MARNKLYKELDNIWYHYKPHLLIGFIILAGIITFVFDSNTKKESALNVALIGGGIHPDKQGELQKTVSASILENPNHQEINLDFWPVAESQSIHMNNELQAKLMAMIAAKDLDIIIMSEEDFMVYAKQGMFLELDRTSEFSHLLAKVNSNLITARIGKEPREHVYGIEINENPFLTKAGFNTQNKVLGIVKNTTHRDTAVLFVKWLFNLE